LLYKKLVIAEDTNVLSNCSDAKKRLVGSRLLSFGFVS
jgi:hypothetical protein